MDRLSFFTCAACLLFLTGRCHCFSQVNIQKKFFTQLFTAFTDWWPTEQWLLHKL